MLRRTPLRNRVAERQAVKLNEPGRKEWKAPHRGKCAACGTWDEMVRHHIVYEQHLRAEGYSGAIVWDLRNALELCLWPPCRAHARHHAGAHRLPRSLIPAAAVEFAVELLGEYRANAYFQRFYSDR
jgi:hypothetical protein